MHANNDNKYKLNRSKFHDMTNFSVIDYCACVFDLLQLILPAERGRRKRKKIREKYIV